MDGDEQISDKDTDGDPGSRARRRYRESAARFARLCLKELRETLRDRRTIVTLVLMPLLVYPLLTMAFQRFLVTSFDTSSEFVIGVDSEEAKTRVKRFVDLGEYVLKREGAARDKDVAAKQAPSKPMAAIDREPIVTWKPESNLEQKVIDGSIHVAIILKEGEPGSTSPETIVPPKCELVYRTDSPASKSALDYVQRRFRAANESLLRGQLRILRRRFRELGADPRLSGGPVMSVRATERVVGDPGTALSLKTLIPLVLILMTITGAVYPAIDLTAGERERGTLEALMAAPVPRLGLLGGKYVAVLTVALLTAGANLVAMTITLASTGLGEKLFGSSGLSLLVLLQVFALLVLFAAFFSAILLAVTSFARSFKEAQAYLIPLMLLSLAPGMMTLMPGLELSGILAITPLVNIVLLARDLLQGEVDPALAVVAVVSTVFYAIAAIGLAARVFGTDALLYGSEASWSDLLRRPARARNAASIAGAMLCLVAVFPCCFIVSSLVARRPDLSVQAKLLLNGVVTVIFFVGLPLAAGFVQRVRIKDGFQLHATGAFAFVAAVVLGLAMWPLAYEVYLLNKLIGLTAVSEQHVQVVKRLLEQCRDMSPLVILLALAVIPAVCEEFFFRGYVFRSLIRGSSALNAILLSAVLFGVFHVITTNLLTVERFLPSTLLGLMLGWVCWRTGSVLPGILLHACHNGLVLMIAYYGDELAARGWGVEERTHLPISWLAAATVGITAGVAIIMLAGSKPANNKVPSDSS